MSTVYVAEYAKNLIVLLFVRPTHSVNRFDIRYRKSPHKDMLFICLHGSFLCVHAHTKEKKAIWL